LDIILRRNKKRRIVNSLRFKVVCSFVLLLVAALLILNIYPSAILKRQMINAAENDMMNRVTTLAAALESFSSLNADNIYTAVTVLDAMQYTRILVTNASGVVIYDSLRYSDMVGKLALFPEIVSALAENDVFTCEYTDESFEAHSAAPIVKDGVVIGSAYFYNNDLENAMLLREVRGDILQISLLALAVTVIFLFFFAHSMGSRLNILLSGVRAVGKGDYDYQIRMTGADELSEIAQEFNDLGLQLNKTEAMRRQFVSDASHELKTPLASIKLLSDSILQTKNIREEDMREFVADIGDEIQRLTRITEGLLSLSRLDALPQVEMSCCDLKSTVQKCAELLRANAEIYEVTVELSVTGRYMVWGTSDGIYHIVFNLMENAIKYNKKGGKVSVTLYREGGKTVLSVKDTGIGIPAGDLGKIYERFYRVDKTRSRETGGTGLGLSIVNEWVENMDARIDVRSIYGEGTEFKVYFNTVEREQEVRI